MRSVGVDHLIKRFATASAAIAVLAVGGAMPAAAADGAIANLVKDINTDVWIETGDIGSSRPTGLTSAGGRLFFNALGPGGRELYVSDGSEAGTLRLSIRSGSRSADPRDITALGNRVLFSANDGSSGRELWVSDGSTAGTRRVKDIRPGSRGSDPRSFAVFGGKVYFSATNGQSGRELWVSDGTATGTRLVRDIKTGSKGSDPQEITAAGGRLFFTAMSTRLLWVSDGTKAGTRAFPNSVDLVDNGTLTVAGDQLFFVSRYAPNPLETSTSIRVVRPGGERSISLLAVAEECSNVNYCRSGAEIIPVGSLVYITGPTRRLFRSDGTKAGTFKLKNLNDCGAAAGRYPECSFAGAFADVDGRLFFVLPQYVYSAEHEAYRRASDQVWTSDGTVAGTRVVKVFDQPSTGWNAPGAAIALNGTYYFTGYDAASGFELWRSDGTAAGTMLAYDIYPSGFDNGWALPHNMAVSSNSLYMSANDGIHGYELWRYQP